MRFFRIKDKRTGLYYMRLRNIQVEFKCGTKASVKSNLSHKGKVYHTDPRKHITSICDHTEFKDTIYSNYSGAWYRRKNWRAVSVDDLEIEYINE